MKLSSTLDLRAYNKFCRWQAEIRGVMVTIAGSPVVVSTARGDDRSALHVNFSAIAAGLRADGAVFNFADGAPRAVSNSDMSAAIEAALTHVQRCFDRESSVDAAILAGTVTTPTAVLSAYVDVLFSWQP